MLEDPKGWKSSYVLKSEDTKKWHKNHVKKGVCITDVCRNKVTCDCEIFGTLLHENFSFPEFVPYQNKIDDDHHDVNQNMLQLDQNQEEKTCTSTIVNRMGKVTNNAIKLSRNTALFLHSPTACSKMKLAWGLNKYVPKGRVT